VSILIEFRNWIQSTFRDIFSSFAVALQLALALFFASTPGMFFLTGADDGIYLQNLQTLRHAIIITGCGLFTLGIVVLFWAIRINAPVGSLRYRITHPRLRR
jgi:cytochrome bd-type quinol oxidase subunit 2